jgi:hypothetical protein
MGLREWAMAMRGQPHQLAKEVEGQLVAFGCGLRAFSSSLAPIAHGEYQLFPR